MFFLTACDSQCLNSSGCSVQGAGNCDLNCTQGFGINITTHTCSRKFDNVRGYLPSVN